MIVTIANQKGGVGKTDLCVNLASSLAQKGRKVLVLDLDPQSNATSYLLRRKPRFTATDLLLDESVKIDDAAVKTKVKNLHVVAGNTMLSVAQVHLMNDPGMQFRLKRKINPNGYDYVFIDTPPSLDMLTINALTASDAVFVPVQAQQFAIDGTERLVRTVKSLKREINPKLKVLGYVLTMVDRRSRFTKEMEGKVRKKFGKTVLDAYIPINTDLASSPVRHEPVFLSSNKSRGARAYRKLATEFESKLT
jgi:chromosome partitioning protein